MVVNQNLPDGPVPKPAGENYTFAAGDVAIIQWLVAQGFTSVSSDGPDKAVSWPHVQVVQIPAGHGTLYQDSSVIQVDVFHPDFDSCADASRVVHFWLTDPWQGLRDNEIAGQKVDDVRGATPGYMDYGDPDLTRFLGSYTVDSRLINPL